MTGLQCGSTTVTLDGAVSIVDPDTWAARAVTDADGDGCAVENCDGTDATLATDDCNDPWRDCVLGGIADTGDSGTEDTGITGDTGTESGSTDTAGAESGDTSTTDCDPADPADPSEAAPSIGWGCVSGPSAPVPSMALALALLAGRRRLPGSSRKARSLTA